MKKLLLFSAFISFAFFANAQSTTYKAFKVDLDFGYAIPSAGNGTGTKAGVTVTVEPHYRLSDDLAVGFRFEGAGLGYQENNGVKNKTNVSILSSYCPTLEYYFAKGGFRPFVGAGLGIFSQQSVSKSSTGNGVNLVPGATDFGFFPRVGFEAGHLRIAAAYDIAGNNSNYLAFTLGFFLGGGKK
jgi:outer membrane protein W